MSDTAESPPPEEPKVEIHKPHAAKTWKEFFIELGTVVLGILIALTLEQTVEAWREHRQYLESRDAMRTELAGALANLTRRRVISECTTKRLSEISALLDKAEKHQAFDAPNWIGEASSARLRFAAENESGRSGLFTPQEQGRFSIIYSNLHSIDTEQDRERQVWARLQMLEGRSTLSPEMIANLRQALAEARFQDERIVWLLGFAKSFGADISLVVPPLDATRQPQVWPVCLPMTTPRQEALRRIVYPGRTL